MSLKSQLIIACAITLLFGIANFAQAQRGSIRINQDFRCLGHFQSAGYHWRTPGPCVGSYNPYSQHNSVLRIGGSPQGAYGYAMPSGGYGCRGSFDNLSTFSHSGHINTAPVFAPGQRPNMVDSVIDDSDPVKPTNEDESDDSGDEISDLESEVQSILNDSQDSNSDKKPEAKDADQPDETSLWPGFQEFGNKNRDVQGISYPVRHPRTAKRYN